MTMSCVSWCGRRLLLGLASTSRLMTARQMSAAAGKLGGKVAIVTASTEGIGYGIAQSLATHGASVMVCSRKVRANQLQQCLLCHLHAAGCKRGGRGVEAAG